MDKLNKLNKEWKCVSFALFVVKLMNEREGGIVRVKGAFVNLKNIDLRWEGRSVSTGDVNL